MFCYDIRNPKRLRNVAKTLENFGIRIQYSFFQCEISKEQVEKLKKALLTKIDTKQDKLFIYPLCEKCSRKVKTDGKGKILKISSFEII
jgi:CRISPR-associated protein Cas2